MARSKKDGKQGGGHKVLRKWQVLAHRRRAQASRAVERSVITQQIEDYQEELYDDLFESSYWFDEQSGADFGWHDADDRSWLEYRHLGHDSQYPDDTLDEEYWHDQYLRDTFEARHDWYDSDPYDYDLGPEVQLAIDRMIRQHGVPHTREHAYIIATMFGVGTDAVNRAINFTPAGYIPNSYDGFPRHVLR